ncbi:MAG TPA: hypothetical protein VJZ00_16330 [Thermoanaerobaculia bacterium]|nr:hypothetical protein [Thermoanaerobaculia bacterium]
MQEGRLRTFVLTFILAALAFGAGFIPKELEARKLRTELKTAQFDLRLANLHRQLGVAAAEAQQNNFGNAANAARVFFDGCRTLSQEEPFTDQPRTRIAIQSYAGYSDDFLPRLGNADVSTKESLARLYLTMDGLIARKQ